MRRIIELAAGNEAASRGEEAYLDRSAPDLPVDSWRAPRPRT